MSLYKACLDYLNIVSVMSEHPGLYTLDSKRAKLHDEIISELKKEFDYDEGRLGRILGSLDIAVNFNPPLTRNNIMKYHASELKHLLTCAEGKYFLEGKGTTLRTKHGTIKAER